MGLFEINELFDAPCIFCGYNGQGYYQAHTHGKDCPFYEIGGASEREHALVVFAKKGWIKIVKRPNHVNRPDACECHHGSLCEFFEIDDESCQYGKI